MGEQRAATSDVFGAVFEPTGADPVALESVRRLTMRPALGGIVLILDGVTVEEGLDLARLKKGAGTIRIAMPVGADQPMAVCSFHAVLAVLGGRDPFGELPESGRRMASFRVTGIAEHREWEG